MTLIGKTLFAGISRLFAPLREMTSYFLAFTYTRIHVK